MSKRKRVVLIGPVYPYRSGIAHYTGLLYQNLKDIYDIELVSYSMQYPKFLYKKKQRDYKNDIFKTQGAHFWLNTANPFNWIGTARKIKRLEPAMIFLQWWHPYFAPCYVGLLRLLKKIPVLVICNNVFPHTSFTLSHALTKSVLKRGDGFLIHSERDQADLEELLPGADLERVTLPTFNVFKQKRMTEEQARKSLGLDIDCPVMLFFGFVEQYKGLSYLLKALPVVLERHPTFKLLIAGEFGGGKQEYMELIDTLGLARSVIVYDEYVQDREVQKFFAASDAAVLPYISATSSGIAQIAYAFHKPIIATKSGIFNQIVLDGKSGLLVKPGSAEELADAILRFYQYPKGGFDKGIEQVNETYSWERLVEGVEQLAGRISERTKKGVR